MANWMDRMGTGLGDMLIGASQPFGMSVAPSQYDRQAAIRAGALNVGLGMLANSEQRPGQAFANAYQGAQQQARADQMQNTQMQMLLEKADENRRQRAAEAEQQKQMEQWISSLPPDQQALARLNPDAYSKGMIGQQFAGNQQPDVFGTVYFDQNNNPYVLDKSGSMRTPSGIPKDAKIYAPFDLSFQKAAGSKAGAGQGEAQDAYASISSKLPGLYNTVDNLRELSKKATYTMTGRLWNEAVKEGGFGATEGAVARTKYEAIVSNQILPLLRDTFGAQFTQREGETLRATLGDPNKTPEEKQAVLDAFIEQKVRDVDALAARTGNVPQSTPQSSPSSNPELEDALKQYGG